MSAYTGPAAGTIEVAGESPEIARFFHPTPIEDRTLIEDPEVAAVTLGSLLFGLDREACVAAYLDTKHRLLGSETVSLGSIDHTFMSPRDLLRGALLVNATAFVVAHNHPSGDPEPSEDDKRVTRRIVQAGELVGIELLDHLVFAGDHWISLARRGLI